MLNDVKETEKVFRRSRIKMGKLVTDPIEKAKSSKSYYASLFSCENNNPQIQSTA